MVSALLERLRKDHEKSVFHHAEMELLPRCCQNSDPWKSLAKVHMMLVTDWASPQECISVFESLHSAQGAAYSCWAWWLLMTFLWQPVCVICVTPGSWPSVLTPLASLQYSLKIYPKIFAVLLPSFHDRKANAGFRFKLSTRVQVE